MSSNKAMTRLVMCKKCKLLSYHTVLTEFPNLIYTCNDCGTITKHGLKNNQDFFNV